MEDLNVTSEIKTNATLSKVAQFFNISVSNVTNQSEETRIRLFDLYEVYKKQEQEQLVAYKYVAIILASLIIVSNLIVVISSGLILRKGQQPKNTYLLLGNVSLADTIIGISIIIGMLVDTSNMSSLMCIFQIGLIVCPVIVSIFSVGLIAIDRYIYILHGLYYQRWFSTTRIRIAIMFTWLIGITLGYMPVTGWIKTQFNFTGCSYNALFPDPLILLNALLSMIPIVVVAILYSIILERALKNVREIKSQRKSINMSSNDKPYLRVYRGTGKIKNVNAKILPDLKRSASFHSDLSSIRNYKCNRICKSKSTNDLRIDDSLKSNSDIITSSDQYYESNISIITIQSNSKASRTSLKYEVPKTTRTNKKRKEPNKWRAILVVMLTSSSFVVSWTPYFITVMIYLFCEDKFTNPQCIHYRKLITGPLVALAFFNSIINPFIYAWWHKDFQRNVKFFIRKYIRRCSSSGIFVACLPAMGWTGNTFRNYRCWYITVFPPALLIVMSMIVLSVIIFVCILYFLILRSAVRTVNKIREMKVNTKVSYINEAFENHIESSAAEIEVRIDDMIEMKNNYSNENEIEKNNRFKNKLTQIASCVVQLKVVDNNPSKFKAIKTVLLVTACFLGTWGPYYIAIIMYVHCDIESHGYDCIPLEILTLGPLYLLGISNSLLDPMIYAWRHSGFKRTVLRIYWKFLWKFKT